MPRESTLSYDRASLTAAWQRFYKGEPPKGLSRQTLELAVAYHRQARKDGGLNPDLKRHLLTLANKDVTKSITPHVSRQVKPGARLVRTWRGRPHIVDVLESGFLYDEQIYGSLTEIARAITGSHWSGPRFFGLVGRAKAP